MDHPTTVLYFAFTAHWVTPFTKRYCTVPWTHVLVFVSKPALPLQLGFPATIFNAVHRLIASSHTDVKSQPVPP